MVKLLRKIIKLTFLLFISLFFFGFFSQSANAINSQSAEKEKDRFYTKNNILYYQEKDLLNNQGDCKSNSNGGTLANLSGNGVVEQVVDYFSGNNSLNIKLEANAIAGILGNFQAESGMSAFRNQGQITQTGKHENKGYGIAQFTGREKILTPLRTDSRTAAYFNDYYKDKYGGIDLLKNGVPEGVPPEVASAWLEVQLDFIVESEFHTTKVKNYKIDKQGASLNLSYLDDNDTLYEALKKAKSAEDAARIFLWLYERPNNKEATFSTRKQHTEHFLSVITVEGNSRLQNSGEKSTVKQAGTVNSLQPSSPAGKSNSSQYPLKLMQINDPERLAKVMDDWVAAKYPTSPYVGLAKYAVAGGQRAGVNPIIVYVQARQESQFGTYEKAGRKFHEGHNGFGRTASSSQPAIIGPGKDENGNYRRWFKWDSLQESLYDSSNKPLEKLEDMYAYFRRKWTKQFGSLDITIDQYMHAYAPSFENDTSTYIKNIIKWTNEIYELAGDAIDTTKLGTPVDYKGETNCPPTSSTASELQGVEQQPGVVKYGNFTLICQGGDNMMTAWRTTPVRSGCNTIELAGCGMASIATVMTNLLGKLITPLDVLKMPTDYSGCNMGWSSVKTAMPTQGLKVTNSIERYGGKISAQEINQHVKPVLERGGMVVASVNSTGKILTTGGHIIVIAGLNSDGTYQILNPNCWSGRGKKTISGVESNKKMWTAEELSVFTHGLWMVEK